MFGIESTAGTVGLIAVAGAIAAGWRQVLGLFQQASNYLVGCAHLEYWASRAVCAYLSERRSMSYFRPRWFDGAVFYVRTGRRRELVIYEKLNRTTTVAFIGWVPVLLTEHKEGTETRRGAPVALWWIRGTLDIDRLIAAATDLYNHREHSSEYNQRFRVIRKVGRGGSMRRLGSQGEPSPRYATSHDDDYEGIRIGSFVPLTCKATDVAVDAVTDHRAFEVYSFDDEIITVVDEVRQWHKSGDWYRDRGIPWTRGWLLVSPPGTGKTSLLRAIAQELDLPVYLFDLASMSNEEFSEAWGEVGSNSPCMAVFEDLDGVFHGRKNVLGDQGGGLTFDCLLNCISGISQSDGVFTAFTTNDITKIDPAIAQPSGNGTTRPGRVDRIIELGPMSEKCRRRHATRVLTGVHADIEAIVLAGDGTTAAQFNDLCVRKALAAFWDETNLKLGATTTQKDVA